MAFSICRVIGSRFLVAFEISGSSIPLESLIFIYYLRLLLTIYLQYIYFDVRVFTFVTRKLQILEISQQFHPFISNKNPRLPLQKLVCSFGKIFLYFIGCWKKCVTRGIRSIFFPLVWLLVSASASSSKPPHLWRKVSLLTLGVQKTIIYYSFIAILLILIQVMQMAEAPGYEWRNTAIIVCKACTENVHIFYTLSKWNYFISSLWATKSYTFYHTWCVKRTFNSSSKKTF